METAFSVVHDLMVSSGRMSMSDLARVMSTAPARIAGLAAHGQALEVGAPANLVLVDPTAEVTVDRDASASLSRNNPYHGRTFTGAVRTTILRGRVTAAAGEAHA